MNHTNKRTYIFEVECIEAGQRRAYGDSYYHYVVRNNSDVDYSDCVIKDFCMNFLRKSYESKDMPNPFAGKLVSFKKISDRTFEYKTEEMYTD